MNKAVLLDLQGTLGGSGLDDIRTFSFYPFSMPAIKIFNEIGYLVIIITNQSCISKGEFTYSFFEDRTEELKQKVSQYGGKIDGVYCCPHTRVDKCDCIKPLPGMVFRAKKDFKLELSKCYVIGDSGGWDIVLAHRVGAKSILVKTGLGESSLTDYKYLWENIEADYIAENILEAAKWIRRKDNL